MDLRTITERLSSRYRLQEELGRGGMATVYRALDVRHNRDVAIKFLSDDLIGAAGADRFVREIAVTGRLTHPHILPLLDSGEVEGTPFYVMPLASGETLRARMTREGPLPVNAALALAAEIASALDFAHRQGIVHRDVKPENILLQDGHAMVADFGIAKALTAGVTADGLTATGVSVGTPAYMAPEQALGDHEISARTDVYALGCVLYEMLTGTPPFHAASARGLMARHASDPVPGMRGVRPGISEAIESVVTRALAKEPADRFSSAGEMRDAILAATNPSAETPQPARRVRPRPLVAVAVIAAALFVVFVATRRDDPSVAQAGAPDAASTRLAVLPMANIGADTADAYFAAGMTEELISTLSDIAGIQVMARGAVMPYAGSSKPLGDIGRELGVGSLIESSCRKDGNRLRISIRLVDARTLAPRWSQQYDRELIDAFSIQRDIARNVAAALRLQMSGHVSAAAGQLPATNAAAYEAYLRGRILQADIITDQSSKVMIAHLERAVALDSNFALAHATLAKAYVTRLFRFAPGEHFRKLAAESIDRALHLDSTLAEAYLARADLAYTPEAGWRHDDALRDYLHARALKPGLSQMHGPLGAFLFHVGLLREALRELRIAVTLDPSDEFSPPRVGRALWYTQQNDSALAAFDALPIPPERAIVLGKLGRAREGLAYLDSSSAPSARDEGSDGPSARAVLYAQLGDRARALEAIQKVDQARPAATAHFHHALFNVAMALALLGERERAVQELEEVASRGMPAYELFLNESSLASLRGYPPFERFVDGQRAAYEQRRAAVARAGIVP